MVTGQRRPFVEPLTSRIRLPLQVAVLAIVALAVGREIARGHTGLAAAAILAAPLLVYLTASPLRALELGLLVMVLSPPETTFGLAQLGEVRVAAMLAILAVALNLYAHPHVSRLTLVDWAVIGLVALTLVSWASGARQPHTFRQVTTYLLPIVFFAGGRRFGERSCHRLYLLLFGATALGSLTVLYEEFVAHRPLFTNPQSYDWLASSQTVFRPGGVFTAAPVAATMIVLTLFGGLLLIGRSSGLRRAVLLALLGISLASLFFTFTRGPAIGLGIGLVLFAVLRGAARSARYVYAAAIAAVLVAFVVIPGVQSATWYQQGVLRHGTLAARQTYWHEAWVVIRDSTTHELVGHGPASVIVGLPWVPGQPQADIAEFPGLTFVGIQNQYIRLLVELGGLGLALFLGWIGGTILRGARAALRGRHRDEIAAGVAACVAFAVTSLVGDTLWEPQTFATVALLSGIVVSLATSKPSGEHEHAK